MRLRNKKTGEVIDLDIANIKAQFGGISVIPEPVKLGGDEYVYHSLAELNADWEDYKPTEPLIKDEKIRKAVRAWAEANGREYLLVIKSGGRLEISDGSPHLIYVSFHVDNDTLKSLDDRTYYPIAELCGEERE